MVLYSKNIVLEHGILDGFLELENGRIKGIYDQWQGKYVDYSDLVIFPGLLTSMFMDGLQVPSGLKKLPNPLEKCAELCLLQV